MGYDQHQQPNSSGAAAAIAVAVLLVAIIGVLALAGAWLLLVRTDGVQMQTVATKQRVVVELHGSEAIQADGMAQLRLQEASDAATPDPRLDFVLQLDREGNVRVNDETIGLDELKTQLVKAKDMSSNEFLLRIIADSDCPKKDIKSVVAVFDEVGGIAWGIVSPENADAATELNNVPN